MQFTPAIQIKINPRIPCATCGTPTYLLVLDFKPECCTCLEKRLGQKINDAPDIIMRDGRIHWTKV
jgi:hypothetical protein